MELDGQSAIVTGAAQGIGKGIALELAQRGANVVLCDIQRQALEQAAEEIRSRCSVKVLPAIVDISVQAEVERVVREAAAELGGIEILVNNAGIHPLHLVEDISEEEWDRVLAVNLKAQFLFCKAVLPIMRRQKYGRIVNIASEAGKNGGTVAASHYAASKGGVLAFTRHLAQEVGADGITVNAVCPGRIVTAMSGAASPEENQRFINNSVLKRLGDAEDVAFAVGYLVSPRAKFITAESMMVNGGTLRD